MAVPLISNWLRAIDDGLLTQVCADSLFHYIEQLPCFSTPSTPEKQTLPAQSRLFGDHIPICVRSIAKSNKEDLFERAQIIMADEKIDEQALYQRLIQLFGSEEDELVTDLVGQRHRPTVNFLSSAETKLLHEQANRPHYGQRITFQTQKMKSFLKKNARHVKSDSSSSSPSRVFVPTPGITTQNEYPFVFDSERLKRKDYELFNYRRYTLPGNTIHLNEHDAEEFIFPIHQESNQPFPHLTCLSVAEAFPPFFQSAFTGYAHLNKMQSVVYPCAFHTNENMLVCAPTGAGKTDVATMVMLRVVHSHMTITGVSMHIATRSFKAIYIAPMKALASEIVAKFSTRLGGPLRLTVKEYTGDMQLSRAEIDAAQLIVTTPEKWDVITRKGTTCMSGSGDSLLLEKVKLVIIDEVHLLHDDRGAVLEAIIARTLRQVEQAQRVIRLVGLSATLPNYVDVAAFLRVNPHKGLFYFDASFRPVPLAQQFIGIKKKGGSEFATLNQICFEKAMEDIVAGYQVLIFVHSRSDTLRTAYQMHELAQEHHMLDKLTLPPGQPQCSLHLRELKKLIFSFGIGVHHAGLSRSDRHTVERLFSCGQLKLLVCTATLAWGVNLPAHTVIIKGTNVYDATKGGFVDLSILDVLQIFGRAGRPQYESEGRGVLITQHDRLAHYLTALTQPIPIESHFSTLLTNHLNAEIHLGNVTNMTDALSWLKYTYFWIRMRKNPTAYGITWKEMEQDPMLEMTCKQIIEGACLVLHQLGMIRYDPDRAFVAKDIGRIASHYYIPYLTVEQFMNRLAPSMNDSAILSMFAQATEFNQLKVRDTDEHLLSVLCSDDAVVPIRIIDDINTIPGKVAILLQLYISRWQGGNSDKHSSILSDLNYVSQNAGRLFRSLFEFALLQRYHTTACRLLDLCKCIDHQLWPTAHPLCQCCAWPRANEQLEPILAEQDIRELKKQAHSSVYLKNHPSLVKAILSFPLLVLQDCQIVPQARGILCLTLSLALADCQPEEKDSEALHYWLWIIDDASDDIVYSELISIKRSASSKIVTCYLSNVSTAGVYTIKLLSDRWLKADPPSKKITDITWPVERAYYTELIEQLRPLSIAALHNPLLEQYYAQKDNGTGVKDGHFNALITQSFHSVYYAEENILFCAPMGSGKQIIAELAIWHTLFVRSPEAAHQQRHLVLFLTPWKHLQMERYREWKDKFWSLFNLHVCSEIDMISRADILITTPERWVRYLQHGTLSVQRIQLIILDEIQLLGAESSYEHAIVQTRAVISARYVALGTTTLSNALDLAEWLGIPCPRRVFNFRPSVRPIPCLVSIKGFSDRQYYARMESMSKSISLFIQQYTNHSIIVFVSSRKQCRLTCQAILSYSGGTHQRYLDIENLIVQDLACKNFLSFGIGMYHGGMDAEDQQIVASLFQEKKILILVATQSLTWRKSSLLFCNVVIIKGTEYHSADKEKDCHGDAREDSMLEYPMTDILQMMGRADGGRDHAAFVNLLVAAHKKAFYKQSLTLDCGYPLESDLVYGLVDLLGFEIVLGKIANERDALAYLSWTFLAKRFISNPSRYTHSRQKNDAKSFFRGIVQEAFQALVDSHYIQLAENRISVLPAGKIAQAFHLQHVTVRRWINMLNEVHPRRDDYYSFTERMNRILWILCQAREWPSSLNNKFDCESSVWSCIEKERDRANISQEQFVRLAEAFLLLIAEHSQGQLLDCVVLLHSAQCFAQRMTPCPIDPANRLLLKHFNVQLDGDLGMLPFWVEMRDEHSITEALTRNHVQYKEHSLYEVRRK